MNKTRSRHRLVVVRFELPAENNRASIKFSTDRGVATCSSKLHLSFVPEEDTDWEFREALRREETDVEEVLLEKEEEEVSGYGKLFCGILGREILIGRARILI